MVPNVSDEYKQSHNFIEYFAETYMKPLNDIYDSIQALDKDDSSYYDQWNSLADQYQEGLSTYKAARQAASDAYATNRMSEVESSVDSATGFRDEFDMALDVYIARHSDTLLFGKKPRESTTLTFYIDHGDVSNDFDGQASSHFDDLLVSQGALHRLEALAPEKHDTFEASHVRSVMVYHDFGDELVNGYRCLVGYPKSDTDDVRDINVVLLPLDDTGRLPDYATINEASRMGSLPDLYKAVFVSNSINGFHDIGYRERAENYNFDHLLNAYDDAYHVLKSTFELEHENSFAWERFESFMNSFNSSADDKNAHMASVGDIDCDLTGETTIGIGKDTSKVDSKGDFGE